MASKNRIYECEIGGATYWVAAYSAENAIGVLREDASAAICCEDTIERVASVPKERAEKLTFHDDRTGTDRDMWAEFERDSSSRLIACSEWP